LGDGFLQCFPSVAEHYFWNNSIWR